MNGKVFIHVDAGGTYRGNGGLISLLGLADVLSRDYKVAIFDVHDRLDAAKMGWTVYTLPEIVPVQAVVNSQPDELIITTWLHGNMLAFLTAYPALWAKVRYWCTGELLRDGLETSREALLEQMTWIAVCNFDLAPVYVELGFEAVFNWTNWVRNLFCPDASVRIPGSLGYQPDQNGDEALDILRSRYGDRLILCTGSQRDVAAQMQQCDMFLAWNKRWSMVHGPGESFGLTAYEAMASGCIVIGRAHSGNRHWPSYIRRGNALAPTLDYIDLFFQMPDYHREECRQAQRAYVEERYRLDNYRTRAIREFLTRRFIAREE